jgi:Spy/CpxP family protein refolding chaperone
MRNILILMAAIIMSVSVTACGRDGSSSDQNHEDASLNQPYANLVDRKIRALSDEQVDDLLAGNGAGYALAAELNSYPGPTHVLDLAEQLDLTPDQRDEISAIFEGMSTEAQELGRTLVDLESDLDQRFRDGDIDEDEVLELASEIGRTEGRLRTTHLVAHLRLKSILTAEQVAEYDQLRGYTGPGDADGTDHHDHHGHDQHS